jgi:serine/threonine protein kinase
MFNHKHKTHPTSDQMQGGPGFKSIYNKEPITKYYDIGRVLGSGNYSTVKECVEKATGKHWAAKIISKAEAGPKGLQMVQNEVEILASCNHPNIVRLKEVFETDEHYYLLMELIRGGELFDKIVELQQYSERDASRLIRQIVSALAHLHERQIVHRDLKPENLLLENDTIESPVLLADFGLSKVLDPKHPLNVPVGTPGYVAPEVVECLEDDTCTYGLEIDMWAVGVVLYILLCGYPPFYAEDDDEVFDQILEGNYSYPESHWGKISAQAKDLIDKLLVLDPAKRLTAKQALEHPWLSTVEVSAEPLPSTLSELKRFNAKRKWKGAILATMALNRLTSKMAILRINSSHKDLSLPARAKSESTSSASASTSTSASDPPATSS